jgi:hypothetical protein
MTTSVRSVLAAPFATLVLVLAADTARSQSIDDGVVSLDLRVVSAAKITSVPLTYRLYEEAPSLSIEVSVYNESGSPVIVDDEVLKRSILVRLGGSDAQNSLATEWTLEPVQPGTLKPVQLGAPLVLESQKGVAWLVTCTRPNDQMFSEGRYTLELVPRDLARAVQRSDGSTWRGRVPSQTVRFSLVVSRATTARERADASALAGDEAVTRGDDEAAVVAYQRAMASARGDLGIQEKLAATLLHLRRYRQAVELYEQLMPTLRPGSLTFLLVAKAYLGLADDAGARRVLRLGGMSDARANDHIKELKAQDPSLPR